MDYSGAFDVEEEDDSFLEPSNELDYTENVIFLVDCSQKMFEPVADTDVEEFKEQPRISVIMKTINTILKARIIKSPSDKFGLVFYSAQQSNSDEGFENVRVAMDMNFLSSGSLQDVGNWCRDDGVDRLTQDVGSSQNSSSAEDLKYGLWQCQKMFTDNKNPKISRHIMLFSALKDPCHGQQEFKQQIMSKIQSLRNANVRIDAFPLLDKKEEQEISQESGSFWKELVSIKKQKEEAGEQGDVIQEEGEEEEEESVYLRLEDLQPYIVFKQYKKRTTGSMLFSFSEQFQISIQTYNMVMPASKSRTKYLHLQTNTVLKSRTALVNSTTGAQVQKQDVQYRYEVSSGEKLRFPQIVLTGEELQKLKHPKETGLLLLGFRSMDSFKDWWQLKAATFCYPDERKVKGSTTAFIALYTAMQEKNKFAICRCVRRSKSSPPMLVALVPQTEVSEDTGFQLEPPGFQMYYLPFMDSFRSPEDDPAVVGMQRVQADEEAIAAAESIIDKFMLEEYSAVDVTNPHLQRHYQVIEAVALEQPVPEIFTLKDSTLPDLEIVQKISEDSEIYKRQIYGDNYDFQMQQQNKKQKVNTSSAKYETYNWNILARDNQLNKLTVNDLKLYLTQHRLPVSGKKAEIIERIKKHQGV